MDKKDPELAARERARSLDQMKSKTLVQVEKMLRGMQQPELAKIAFSVQHWHDVSCSADEFYIPGPPSRVSSTTLPVLEGNKDDERLRNWRKKIRHKLAQSRKDELISLIMEEADRLSYPNLQHLSQSLIALQRRKN